VPLGCWPVEGVRGRSDDRPVASAYLGRQLVGERRLAGAVDAIHCHQKPVIRAEPEERTRDGT
jgi:hypothetical protein